MTNLSSTSEKPDVILPSGFGLGPRELDSVFPFHFVIDSDTRVIRAGPAILRLLPDLAGGKKLDGSFRIKHPANLVGYKEICEHSDQLFLLEARSLDKLLLKGQMLHLPHDDAIVFIGAPWLTDSSDINALGLTLNDFAIHDSVPDYLLLLHTLKTSLGDAQVLAEQLNAMNRQLEDRIEERTQEVASANVTLTETNHRLLQEIAERKRAEQILFESESRFRMMSDSAPVLIWMSGTDKLCNYFNKVWLDFTGRTPEQEMGNGWAEGVHQEDFQRCLDTYISAFDARREFSMEYRLRRHDGEYRRVVDCGIPRYDDHGIFLGYIGSCIDITERREFEEELKRSNAELEQFSYAVSHDMRQPLRMISSYLQLLEISLADQLDGEKRGYFNFAIEGAKRIDQMLVALLEYSRVGRAGETLSWIDSRAVLDEALQFLQPVITEAQAKLSIAGEWPPILASHDEILRLLQVFQRLQSREAYEGTGIGLALCRKIAEHHKGRIWAESAGEGQGSRFCVVLPVPGEKK